MDDERLGELIRPHVVPGNQLEYIDGVCAAVRRRREYARQLGIGRDVAVHATAVHTWQE